MNISEKGIELIKKFEGFRSGPYRCAAGIATIGYGTIIYPNGTKVKLTDANITEEQATTYLLANLKSYIDCVNRRLKKELTQNQFDALVSLAYNIGTVGFESSTLARRIDKDPSNPDIEKQFLRWNKVLGEPNNGLTKRRKEEARLYFTA